MSGNEYEMEFSRLAFLYAVIGSFVGVIVGMVCDEFEIGYFGQGWLIGMGLYCTYMLAQYILKWHYYLDSTVTKRLKTAKTLNETKIKEMDIVKEMRAAEALDDERLKLKESPLPQPQVTNIIQTGAIPQDQPMNVSPAIQQQPRPRPNQFRSQE